MTTPPTPAPPGSGSGPPRTPTGSAAVLQLTDEELAVLSGTEGLSVFPVLGEYDAREREVALRTAYRSMVARGLVEAPTPEEEKDAFTEAARAGRDTADVPIRLPESVSSVLALRAGATRAVAVALTTAAGQEFRYAYVVDDVVLEEHVTGSGLHTFALSRDTDLPATVAQWALHPDAADGSGEPVRASVDAVDPTPPAEVLERAGAALLRADVVVRVHGEAEPELVGILSGPEGTWLSRVRYGSGGEAPLVPGAVSAARAALADALAALDPGR